MNELKPEDVMEEAECCGYATGCTDCVLAKYDGSPCIVKKALAFLREKDALIAGYIRQIAEMQREIACQADLIIFYEKCKQIETDKDAEIERLQGALKAEERHNELTMECAKKALANARAEAITEFAERLKTFYDHLPGTTVGGAVMFHVDLIAKEMKGATNGSDKVH